jgi:hypothetical protein
MEEGMEENNDEKITWFKNQNKVGEQESNICCHS